MKQFSSSESTFQQDLAKFLEQDHILDNQIENTIIEICNDVKIKGDRAVIKYTQKFDHIEVENLQDLILQPEQLKQAFETLDLETQKALKMAAERILNFHQRQKQESWTYQDELGNTLGQKITPIKRVGIYVPGGKAAYPSSVLMNALPAKVAGVKEILMVVPTPNGEKNLTVLAAAYLAGVTKVITIGGAQAIAALAYGTESIQPVDKITGPGNAYVAAAKKYVYGMVGIDMIAGPSEILIISDGSTHPDWIAIDLFSQAEHDELARSILITHELEHIQAIQNSIQKLLPLQPRKDIIQQSLHHRGAFIYVSNMDEACEVANYVAPEHLELSIYQPELLLDKIHNAGAIFLGSYTTESLGDYCAGPNHVLPTNRTARFASPLGVDDFQKKSSIIQITQDASSILGHTASILARKEGLIAHAMAAEFRIKSK